MVLKSAYRPGILFDEEIERVRVPPLQSCFAAGAKSLSHPTRQDRTGQMVQDPLDRFFENGGKPVVPKSQPIHNPQQQAQPAVKRPPQVRSHAPKAPIKISPERARKIREMRNRESGGIHTIKHRIKLRETEQLLKELVRTTTSTVRGR